MMNFMGRSSRQGFNEELEEEIEERDEEEMLVMSSASSSSSSRGKIPLSHPSSSSSTLSLDLLQHKGLVVPFPSHQQHQYHQQHQHEQQRAAGWLENKFFDPNYRLDRDHQKQHQDEAGEDVDARQGLGGDHSKEHMFDKVVTPSDVGKLNRLVIPKQHAEKYFPLDSTTNDNKAGLLLNFEDRNGKAWRFRYSYWNSSQSYVMTKGWSRFVKEKKLDAGDIVSFHRGVGDLAKDRLYIDWRRRPLLLDAQHHHHLPPQVSQLSSPHHYYSFNNSFNVQQHPTNYPNYAWRRSPLLLQHPTSASQPASWVQFSHMMQPNTTTVSPAGHVVYLRSTAAAAPPAGPQQVPIIRGESSGVEPMVLDSVPLVVQGKATAKRLRLFGVNMDCPVSEDEDDVEEDEDESEHAVMPHQLSPPPSSISPHPATPSHLLHKGKSSMSLDFDI